MSIREDIEERYYGTDDECILLFLDGGFDDAIAGVVDGISVGHNPKVCYFTSTIIEILISQGFSDEEAYEHFDFNITGSYMGVNTPVFLDIPNEDEFSRRKRVKQLQEAIDL